MRTSSPDDSAALVAAKRRETPAQAQTRVALGWWASFVAGQLAAGIVAMRPRQWVKNGLVVLALVFASKLGDAVAVERTFVAFVAFCLAASGIYLVNDVMDRENDRQHPRKRLRPVASGRLLPRSALLLAAALCSVALALAVWLARQLPGGAADPYRQWGGSSLLLVGTLTGYIALNLLYSGWLKHLVLWDVFAIAAGFVLRAMAGGFAIPVPISPWFYLCTTFLALFLALGKRRTELVTLEDGASSHRANLRHYSLPLLDQLIAVVVTCTVLTYSLYTIQGLGASHSLVLTIPFVLFGVARYLYLIYVRHEGDQPDEVLYRDPQILGAVVLCGLVILALLYGVPALR